jgi:uncharacterized protein
VKGTLAVFARVPQWGRVKTRLARQAGPGPALAAYRAMLTQTLFLARDKRWRAIVAVTPPHIPLGERRFLSRMPQGQGDLGARMERVFRGRAIGPIVIVGTDCPAMRKADIAAAFRALGQADAVFGPAEDGGYYLIGLKRLRACPRLFSGVRWSSGTTLADTLASLPKGWRVQMLRTLSDVDDAAGWAREKSKLSFPSALA